MMDVPSPPDITNDLDDEVTQADLHRLYAKTPRLQPDDEKNMPTPPL